MREDNIKIEGQEIGRRGGESWLKLARNGEKSASRLDELLGA